MKNVKLTKSSILPKITHIVSEENNLLYYERLSVKFLKKSFHIHLVFCNQFDLKLEK